jgi:hypothetical protein
MAENYLAKWYIFIQQNDFRTPNMSTKTCETPYN